MESATAENSGGAENEAEPNRASPARRRLLDAVIQHFSRVGLADQSLRQIADAVGSSHRMLLYHFGSRDGLLVAVVQEVEARTKVRFAGLGLEAGGDTDELIRRMWEYVADPAQADFERLFFALYSRALQGEQAARPLLAGEISEWLDVTARVSVAAGIPVETARAHARLGLAVTRGLLLDLLASGDRTGVDAALEAFASRYEGSWWEAGSSDRAS